MGGDPVHEAAGLETVHGDPRRAIALLETAVDSLHLAGNDVGNLALAFADLAVLFDRLDQPEIAATLYGVSRRDADIGWALNLPTVVDHLRELLGESVFDDRVAAGAAMDFGDAVHYAQDRLEDARSQLADGT